jgi:Ti-type conjugative transfer relaxase TraA
MAIYHFSAKVISRAVGSSALAAAAYRSASRLYDERLDRHHDFSNKAGVVHSEVMLPDGAPDEWQDRAKLWNAVEAAEVRKDAQLARELEFALPRELDQAEGIRLARDFVQRECVDRGMVADLNVHWDVGADGEAKPHAHVMLSMRAVTDDGFGAKVRDWNRTELLTHWREAWAEHVNQRLAELDIDARIDHRSLDAQGIDLEPQHKIGPAASRMAVQGHAAERLDEHHAIARTNGEKILANPTIALDAITHGQATFTNRDLALFVHRHSEGKEQFDGVLAAVKASPDLVALGKDGRGEPRFTSRDMLETEQRLERASAVMAQRVRHHVADGHRTQALAYAAERGMILSPEQHSAFEHATGGEGLSSVIGYAGSGKSAMLGVAREAWERAGYSVQGAALSGIAAENLNSGSGIASRTIASLEHQWKQDRDLLTPRSILVIDEAGLIGARQMERVMAQAQKQGAKVVLVGDAQQLQAIEAGAAFRSIAERHGAVEITQVRRQLEDWQREATRALATGRTGDALAAYAQAGMICESETRAGAREALVERWDSDRQAHAERSRMIFTHTNEECDELSGQIRERLKQHGMLEGEIPVQTSRGERLFAPGDRLMFLRNERSLDVKNGTLATIERIDTLGMAVRTDDGRRVAFDHKDYADLGHGYAATIHKAQGVTVDQAHVLATPGLDSHAAYVGLSRHRVRVDLHYGRDDFANQGKLARMLGRERPKDSALDYGAARSRFAEQRGFQRSAILDTLAKERIAEPGRSASAPEPDSAPRPERRRGMFEGLRLRSAQSPRQPSRDPFAGIGQGRSLSATMAEEDRGLGQAVQRYGRAVQAVDRMTVRGQPVLEYQKKAQSDAARALDQIRGRASLDVDQAFARDPGLVAEAANGKTAATIRAMQLEAELRTNAELRADRFVQSWQQLRAERDTLSGGAHEEKRAALETRMTGLVKSLGKDPDLGAVLSRRGAQLGLGPQWARQWSPGSRGGDIGQELSARVRTQAVMEGLTETLGRGRTMGLGL